MSTRTSKGPLDKAGAFFHKSPGVVDGASEQEQRAAIRTLAAASTDREDFVTLVDMLGLTDAMHTLAQERRAA